jgi:hypothetical protein
MLTISVYEKRGLKRGNPITDASFMGLVASFIIFRIPLQATGGGPLGGPTYQVEPVGGLDVWICAFPRRVTSRGSSASETGRPTTSGCRLADG